MPANVITSGTSLAELPIDGPRLMQELGDLALRRIRTRTEGGRDVRGAAFAPLSPAYAKQKAAAGLPPVADLQVSGRMLNDMAVIEVTDRTATLGFTSSGGTAARSGRRRSGSTASTMIQRSRSVGAADKAFYHNESGAGASHVIREFFALSPDDERALEDAVEQYLDSVLP